MRSELPPILVVGAGPVGLSLTLALARQGTLVRLIDKLPEPINQSRAAIVHARTLEMFERLGIVDEFLQVGVRVHGVAVYGPDNRLLFRPIMDALPTHYPFMLGIEQSETERILANQLSALGIQVERGVELLGLLSSETGVCVRLKLPNGKICEEQFTYVIGTDGGRSTVRQELGLTLEGETIDAIWITADVRIDWDRSPDEALAYLTPDGFAFIAPMNDNRWRVIVNLHKMTHEESERITLDEIQRIVRERFGIAAPLYDPVWISPFSINTRMTPTMRVSNVFLAGDASHVLSPVGGQGMNTGIQDALNLAWKLSLVAQGRAREELLETYNAERHENAKRLLSLVGPATRIINLRHPMQVKIRNLVLRLLNQIGLPAQVIRNFSMLSVAYPNSPLNGEHLGAKGNPFAVLRDKFILLFEKAPRPGQRAPDAAGLVGPGGNSVRLHELWRSDPRFQLLVFAGDSGGAFSDFDALENTDLFKVTRIAFSVAAEGYFIDSEKDAHGTYGVCGSACYLIRPDGYIAFRSQPADLAALRAYLEKWHLLSGMGPRKGASG